MGEQDLRGESTISPICRPRRTLAATIKARRIDEQAHQQLKKTRISRGHPGKAFSVTR